MIWPVRSFIVALRLPFTAVVATTPSLAALPPNKLNILPRMPPSETWVFSRVLTSAPTGMAVTAMSGNATAQEINRRLIRVLQECDKICSLNDVNCSRTLARLRLRPSKAPPR